MEPSISKRSTCTSATSSDSIWSSLGDHIGILLPYLDAWSSHEKSCCRVIHRYLMFFFLLSTMICWRPTCLCNRAFFHGNKIMLDFYMFAQIRIHYIFVHATHPELYDKYPLNCDVIRGHNIFLNAKKVPSQMWGMLSPRFRCSENWKAALCSPHNDLAVHVRTATCLFFVVVDSNCW